MTKDSNSIQSRYSILLSPEADEKVVSAIRDIEEGYEAGSISNALYVKINKVIYYRIKAIQDKAADVYFEAMKQSEAGGSAHDTASRLYYNAPFALALQNMLSFGAKLEKAAALKGTSFEPFLDIVTRYHDEMLPLAQKLDALKSMTVKKGAATSANSTLAATSANPDQVRGTCPFCFRTYAVVNGGITRHGFRVGEHASNAPKGERGWRFHTQSCFGSRLLPYEVSSSGVKDGIQYVEKGRKQTEAYLADHENWQTLPEKNGRINKGEKGWEDAVIRQKAVCEKELENIKEKIAQLHEKMGDWEKRPLFNKSGKEVV